MNKYYNILKDLREDNDLKQKDVAERLEISQQYYSEYEKGNRELPIRHLISLCKFYKVSADYILGFTNDPKPQWIIKNQLNITGKNKIHKIEMKWGFKNGINNRYAC